MLSHGFVRLAFVHAVLMLSAVITSQVICYAEGISITYDLQANGPESSTVDECPRLGPCFQYPIDGHIRLTLDPIMPMLSNVDSIILVPPDGPSPFSPIIWDNLDQLMGEYTSDALSADVSMRFVASDAPISFIELFVELTEGRSSLTLTGGYYGIAAQPEAPNSVQFNVNGRAIPEPASPTIVVLGLVAVIASRYSIANQRCR